MGYRMKIRVIAYVLMVLMFISSSCGEAFLESIPEENSDNFPTCSEESTFEESTDPSTSNDRYTPDLTLARQVFDRLQANEGGVFATEGRYSLSRHLSDPYKMGGIPVGWFEYFAYDDVSDPVFPSHEQAEKVTQGLFINEVYDILGRPHYNTNKNDGTYGYQYTMYVLDDGKILLLGYSFVLTGNYTRMELESRIPGVETEGTRVLHDWRILTLIKCVGIEELATMGLGSGEELYSISNEFKPASITKAEAEQIKKGMSYGAIKQLLNSCGNCNYIIDDRNIVSFWWYVSDVRNCALYVTLTDITGSGEHFDGLIATQVNLVETAID